MAVSTSCCLNFSSPTRGSSPSSLAPSHLTKTTQNISWQKNEESWRSQCVLGMACMIIGFETGPLSGESHALAKDLQLIAVANDQKPMTWSDQRKCPPWRTNSFEIIVPENLPRPSAHRKSEDVTHSRITSTIKINMLRIKTNCFSM